MWEPVISKADFPEGALDPQVAEYYRGAVFTSPFGKLPVEKIRAALDEIYNDRKVLVELSQVQDVLIPSAKGEEGETEPLALRLYLPSPGPHPILLYFHGGGFVMHNIPSHDNLCRRLAKECEALVISVGYRLAPEHPFPAALEDAFRALLWAREHGAEYGGDPERIFTGGDSSGAAISASLTFLARDRKGPFIEGQLLYYGTFGAVLIEESKTMELYGNGNHVLPKQMLLDCEEAYGPGEGELAAYRDPGKCRNKNIAARTLIVTAEMDPLREDGETFAEMLSEAGDPVRCIRIRGMMHGFMLLWPEFSRCEEVFCESAEFMKYHSR